MKQRPMIALLLVFAIIFGYILVQHIQLNAWRQEKALNPGLPTPAPSWYGLEEMPSDLLQKAQNSLLSYAYLETAESPPAKNTIYGAYLRNGRIIVVIGNIMGQSTTVQVYDRDGNYLMGYNVHFDVKNNVWNANSYDDVLQIYMGYTRCVYCFQQGSVRYDYAPTGMTPYFIFTESEKGQTYDFHVRATDKTVIVQYDDGTERVILDLQDNARDSIINT